MAPYSPLLTASSKTPRSSTLFPGVWRIALAVVLCIGALVRLVPLGRDPIWLDEAYTFWFTDQSWTFLWHSMAATETFPPLYYSLIKLWREVAGSSEAALRLPSALAGILGILVVALAARLAGGRQVGPAFGVMAGGICALWQFQIHYAMEARPYSFGSLASGLMLVGAMQVLRHPAALRRPWNDFLTDEKHTALGLVTLAVGLELAPWSHVMGAIPTLITGCYLLGWWAIATKCSGPVFAKLMAAAGLAVLLYLPNYRFVMTLVDRDMSDFWLTAPGLWKLLQITVQVYAQKVMNLPLKAEVLLMFALIGAGTLGFWRVSRASGAGGRAIFGLTVALMAGHWVAMVAVTYLVQPVLIPRTLIFSQPPLFVMLAGLPWCLPARFRTAAGAGVLVYLMACFALQDIRLSPYSRYGAMVDEIANSPHAAAPVMVLPGQFVRPLDYYTNQIGTPLDIRGFPFGAPDFAQQSPPTDIDDLTPAQLTELVTIASAHPSIWLLMGNGMKNPPRIFEALQSAGFTRSVAVGTADHYPNLNYFTQSDDQPLAFGN